MADPTGRDPDATKAVAATEGASRPPGPTGNRAARKRSTTTGPTSSAAPEPVGAPRSATAPDAHDAILARLESLSAQVEDIREELAASRAAREKWSELAETLVPVSRGAMEVATRELQDLEQDVTFDDVTRFAHTTARAIPDMEVLVGQLGSLSELGHEITSISGAGMARLIEILQEAEDRGYFMFARQGATIADRVVTSFSEDDVRALGDNVVTILNAVKDMTQPEVMALVSRTAVTMREVEETPIEPPSILSLLRSMRDPQTRRGLARVLSMLHTVGAENQPTSPTPTTKE